MQHWLLKTLPVNWKIVFRSAVHKNNRSNVLCAQAQKESERKFPDVWAVLTLPVRNITVKEPFRCTHCVLTLTSVQQKQTPLTVNWVSKCGFIAAKSFQRKMKIKEGGHALC